MRILQLLILKISLMMWLFNAGAFANNPANNSSKISNVYGFSFEGLKDKKIELANFKNKVILVVNTASKCGFTNQFGGLEKIYQKYKDQGFEIIGIPSNDFGGQEPLGNNEILSFCQKNFNVTFHLTQKQIVSGKNAHPFYKFAEEKFGVMGTPKWNFHKYLIDRNGQLVDFFISSTAPDSDKIIKAIEKELKK